MMWRIFILLLSLLLVSCSSEQTDTSLQGYVESRQLNLAPRAIGIITSLNVDEGDQVVADELLFAIDSEREQSRLDESIAAKAVAEARLANLKKGGRPEEIRTAAEILGEAQAALILAEQTYKRTKNLVDKEVIAVARLDQDRASLELSRARVAEAKSRLALIRLPARDDIIAAAEHELEIYITAIIRARAELRDRSVVAPTGGRIETVYRRTGEIAGPAQPVLALLSPDQKRIRFFVPEPMLPRIHHEGIVILHCDNCEEGLQGKITFISDQAEFTPPVIFTEKERAKLVYLVEARPEKPELFLNGQPVTVILP